MPLPRHTPASLEAAYASAAALAETLDFVWPSLPSTVDGTYTVPLEPGHLSVTRWLEGQLPEAGDHRPGAAPRPAPRGDSPAAGV